MRIKLRPELTVLILLALAPLARSRAIAARHNHTEIKGQQPVQRRRAHAVLPIGVPATKVVGARVAAARARNDAESGRRGCKVERGQLVVIEPDLLQRRAIGKNVPQMCRRERQQKHQPCPGQNEKGDIVNVVAAHGAIVRAVEKNGQRDGKEKEIKRGIKEELDEKTVVARTDRGPEPGTMVIKARHAFLQVGGVVHTVGFDWLALRAPEREALGVACENPGEPCGPWRRRWRRANGFFFVDRRLHKHGDPRAT